MLKIKLKKGERKFLQRFVKTGTKKSRAIARANILLLADKGRDNDEISRAANVQRQSIWRTKNRYLKEGLDSALKEKPRSGQPKKYTDKEEAEIIAVACTSPPAGRKKWTVRLLADKMKSKKNLETINRESVRLILKKAKQSLG